jgi:NitT/TauT family transport system substrate-binding protein
MLDRLKRLAGVAAVICAVGALGACGGDDEEAGGTSAKPEKTEKVSLLMNWFAQAEQGGYWQAQAAQTGKADGVDIEVLQGGPQIQTIPQVAAGKSDFGVAQADELMLARAEGVPVVEVFGGMDRYLQCMMYHKSAGIKDWPDVNGHKVAVAPSGGFWPYLKGKFHLDDTKEVNFTGTLANFKRDKDLVQQCFTTSEPYFAKQEKIDFGILNVADGGYNPYAQGLFTSERMIKEKPELVRKVVAAAQEGWKQFLEDPAAGKALVMKVNKDTDPAQFDFAQKTLGESGWFADPIGSMTAERWQTLHDQLKEAGVLKKEVDPSEVWTADFIK